MRTIAIISLLMLFLTGCAASDPKMEELTAPQPAAEAIEESIVQEAVDPVGTIVLKDGTAIELTSFKPMGIYYIHITGKLNGRSSTLIQLTRVDDMRNGWRGISFETPDTFTIRTQNNKEFKFTDARIFIGGDSEDSFSFMSTRIGSTEPEEMTVPKSEVNLIVFKPIEQ